MSNQPSAASTAPISDRPASVAVIGAGIAGVLTAYYLQQAGYQITVFEQAQDAASGTSAANGGQLSYSFGDALADPLLLPRLPGIVGGRDPAFTIGLRPNLELLRWGAGFLRNSTKGARDRNTRAVLALTRRSAELIGELRSALESGQEPSRNARGKLVLLPAPPSAELERRTALKREAGFQVELIAGNAIDAIEPSIRHWRFRPAAAIYAAGDEALDAQQATRQLQRTLMQRGVRFSFADSVRALNNLANHRWQLVTDASATDYDAVIVCTGDAGQRLLAPLNVRLPIIGMAGYSITLPSIEHSPSVSITAQAQRLVYTRLGDRIRIAGFADINSQPDPIQRGAQLLNIARELAPAAADYDTPEPAFWSGVRAMTPNSQPIIGATARPGLFTNLGHGMLGWTLGPAAAEATVRALSEQLARS